jgi:hypothetical protein
VGFDAKRQTLPLR